MARTRISSSCTRKSSYPLKREPAGTSALRICSATLTRGTILPRRRRLAPLAPGFAVVASSMPLGLIRGRPFRPFKRAISSRNSAFCRFSSAFSASSINQSCFSSGGRPSISGGATTKSLNRVAPRRGKRKISPRPPFCPSYRLSDCRRTNRLSILPEVIEAIGRKVGVEDRMLDVPVTQVELDCAGVLAVIGEFEAG